MATTEDCERQHLSARIGTAAGELSVGDAEDRITAGFFLADDPDYPYLTISTLGLGRRQPLAGAEPHELGIQRDGFHDVNDAARITRAFLAAVHRLAAERVVLAPEQVVAIPELEPEFPGRALALVSDFMYTGADRLPMTPDDDDDAPRARWLLLRPIFGAELRWIRTMSQAQVARAFAKAEVRLEDSQRDALLVRLTPHIVASEAPMASPKATHDIKGLYASLEAWLKDHSQPTYADLQPPVSADELKALEDVLGQKLPAELHAALEIHDGQPYLDSYMVMPASRIQQRYERKLESVDKPASEPGNGTCRAVVWSKGWIPFAEDGSQNFLCIDLDPGEKGTAGQVIRWERGAQRAEAAEWKSFGEWLAAMTDACLKGNVEVDDEGFISVK